jgi:acyl-CoA synthetase (AMP-forming)/AMP-acid ligase II
MTPLPAAEPPPFRAIADLVHEHAAARPRAAALRQDDMVLEYAALDVLMDGIAASLQRDGAQPGDVLAVCTATSPRYAALFLGALRAGVVVAPLAPSVTPAQFAAMLADAGARWPFFDAEAYPLLAAPESGTVMRRIALDDAPGEPLPFGTWLLPEGAQPQPVEIGPQAPFNIIYSSGTTGTPKGIVQSHGMR